MRKWIARTFGLCALAAGTFAPVVRADAPAAFTDPVESCTWVACTNSYCCNHCGRNAICAGTRARVEDAR